MNTLDNLKENIREEINNFKKEQNIKNNNNYNYNKKNGNLTSKEILTEYFNKIKQSSKLNISHNSLLQNKNNLDINSLEISGISNFNIDEIKKNDEIKLNNNDKLSPSPLNKNDLYINKTEINNNISEKNNNCIIYETFKNMLNKNKNNYKKEITQNLNQNKNIDDNKIITGRFQNDEFKSNNKFNFIEFGENVKNNNISYLN